jgi:HTH-type transcriptional regulator/antitoxin HigA
MTTATKASRYERLIRKFPLRPIRTPVERNAAEAVMAALAVRDEAALDQDEHDYLEVLIGLIESYDREHHSMPVRRGTPAARLRALMESSQTTPQALRQILGLSQPAVSLLLSGKRQLSKASIIKLSRHFRVDPSYFLAS